MTERKDLIAGMVLQELEELNIAQSLGGADQEAEHAVADDMLLTLLCNLGYAQIAIQFKDLKKWYA